MLLRPGSTAKSSHTTVVQRPSTASGHPTLCACLGVGVNAILIAIKSGWAMSVDAIGASLGVGTSCSGCRPELAALVAAAQQPRATE